MWPFKSNKKLEEEIVQAIAKEKEKDSIDGVIIHSIKLGDEEYPVKYDPKSGLQVPMIIYHIVHGEFGTGHTTKYCVYISIKREILADILRDILPEVTPSINTIKNDKETEFDVYI